MNAVLDEKLITEISDRDAFSGRVRTEEPMGRHTYIGIGGPAALYVVPDDVRSLRHALLVAERNGLQVTALGRGTNVLVGDRGVDGMVVSMLRLNGLEAVGADSEECVLKAGAGHSLKRLVAHSAREGLSGIEGLSGVPGTVGGAVAGNAGAFGYEFGDVVRTVTVMAGGGKIKTLGPGDMDFAYRRSALRAGKVLLEAEIVLKRDEPREVALKVERFIGQKRNTQPLRERSAGCVFMNPEGDSAGRLIDAAGLKGRKIGNIEVSSVHANFFINRGGGTAADFMALVEEVTRRVREVHGVELELEIRLIGR